MIKDLTGLSWSMGRDFSGNFSQTSLGAYYKNTEITNQVKKYYKASRLIHSMGFGDESVYEVIYSRLMRELGISCVDYKLVHAKIEIKGNNYQTYICESQDFAKNYTSRRTFEKFIEVEGESISEIVKKYGFQKMIDQIIIADFITLNFDRHGANVEVLADAAGNYFLAPLFDSGNSFFSPYPSCDANQLPTIREYDVMQNKRLGNHFMGAEDMLDSLKFVKNKVAINEFANIDFNSIFECIDRILPKEYIEKIQQMITMRLSYLKEVGLIEEKRI